MWVTVEWIHLAHGTDWWRALVIRRWTCGIHEMQGVSWPAEELLVCRERLHTMELTYSVLYFFLPDHGIPCRLYWLFAGQVHVRVAWERKNKFVFFQAGCTMQVLSGRSSFFLFFSCLAETFSRHVTTATPLCAEHSAQTGTLNGGDNFRSVAQLLYSLHPVTYTDECPCDLTNSRDQSHCWKSPSSAYSQ